MPCCRSGRRKAQGVAIVESTISCSSGAIARPRSAQSRSASRSCARTSGFGERLGEDQPRLGPNRLDDRVVLAVVDDGDAAADPIGEPRQIRTRLVVDLTHQNGVAAGRHQDVEDSAVACMPESQTSTARACSSALQPRDQRSCRRRAVARVQVRQLRPAAIAAEEKRRLAFLPGDRARRAEEIELNGGFVGMQVGKTGAPRVRDRCAVVQRARRLAHRRQRRPFIGAVRPDRATPRSRSDVSGAPLTPALPGRGSLRRAPDVARRRRPPRSCLRSSSRS